MLTQLLVSFVATASFGIIFSIPKKLLMACGFVGMVGWGIFTASTFLGLTSIPSTLIASFGITALSQLFARRYRTPVTIFSAAGIVPLVPGGQAYYAMRNFVQDDYALAMQFAAKAFLISGAIAMGLILSEVFFQIIRKKRSQF